MVRTIAHATFSVNEAACVTGVPVKQVHRIIDAGLLNGAARQGGRVRLHRVGLVGLRLAHETADLLTREGRRLLLRSLLDCPNARTARMGGIAVDLRPIKRKVGNGLAKLARARAMVRCDDAVLSGTPCIRGTRIPVHDIADMRPTATVLTQSSRRLLSLARTISPLPRSMPAPIRDADAQGAKHSGAPVRLWPRPRRVSALSPVH